MKVQSLSFAEPKEVHRYGFWPLRSRQNHCDIFVELLQVSLNVTKATWNLLRTRFLHCRWVLRYSL